MPIDGGERGQNLPNLPRATGSAWSRCACAWSATASASSSSSPRSSSGRPRCSPSPSSPCPGSLIGLFWRPGRTTGPRSGSCSARPSGWRSSSGASPPTRRSPTPSTGCAAGSRGASSSRRPPAPRAGGRGDSLAGGLPEPPALLLLDIPSVNACAIGATRKSPVLGVTRGLLEQLNAPEQQAVVATLVARITRGDIMVGTGLAALMGPLKYLRGLHKLKGGRRRPPGARHARRRRGRRLGRRLRQRRRPRVRRRLRRHGRLRPRRRRLRRRRPRWSSSPSSSPC